MTEICAELLLSGVLAIVNKPLDFNNENGIIYKSAEITYVVPTRYNIEQNPCKNTIILNDKKIDMSQFLKKTD